MGLNIDQVYSPDSSINVTSIHNTLDNFHSLLLLYDEFDQYIRRFDISHCSKILVKSFFKLSDIIGTGFNDTDFRNRYTSIAMNTYTVFNSLYKDEDYINNSLTQYFCSNPPTNTYLDSIISGSQNFEEIYENILKDVSVGESSDLGNKILREYYKKCEILIKVLYCLTHRSFQMLVSNSGYSFPVRVSNDVTIELKLCELVECFSNLGIFNYFMDLFENFCDTYLDFILPDSISEIADKLSQEFNINVHLKLYCRDRNLNDTMKKEILFSLESISDKLKVLERYLNEVFFMYNNFDFAETIQLNQYEFDDIFLKEFYTRLVGGFYDDFCEKVALLLPVVDALDVIEQFKSIVHDNLKLHKLSYVHIYLQVSLRNWENQLLNYVRTLSLNQYPVSELNSTDNDKAALVTTDYFVKSVNFDTMIESNNTFIAQFLSLINIEHSRNDLTLTQSLNFLNNTESCFISNNLYSIVMLIIKLLLLPIVLNHELSNYFSQDAKSMDHPSGSKKLKNRIMRKYIHNNSKLIQNIVLLYLFNSNTSFKDFLYSICKLDKGLEGLHEIISVFLIYISNIYYINSLVTLIPYLIQCSYFIYSGIVDSTSERRSLLGIIRNNYRVSTIKISLFKLQDYLIAHLSAFNQQYIQKLVSNSLTMLHHTSSESYGNEVLNYLTTFTQLLYKYLPHEIYKSVLTICVDLTYNCIIFEILDFFEGINYKFNQQLFFKIKVYIESISYSINLHITNGLDLDLSYSEKFKNFLKVFSDYNGVIDHLYGHTEFNKINKLIRQIKTF